jgi:hypothetical protein
MKPLLTGYGLTLALLPSLFASQVVAQETSAAAVLAAPGGRYVLGQLSSFRKDRFLLDTQTGRVWVIVVDKTGADVGLEAVPYVADGGTVPPSISGAPNSTGR